MVVLLLFLIAFASGSDLKLELKIKSDGTDNYNFEKIPQFMIQNISKANGWSFDCTETIEYYGSICSRLSHPICYFDELGYFCDNPTFRGDIEDDIVVEGVEYWSSRIRYFIDPISKHVEVKVFPSVNLLIHSFIEWVTEIILIVFLVSLVSSKTSKLM